MVGISLAVSTLINIARTFGWWWPPCYFLMAQSHAAGSMGITSSLEAPQNVRMNKEAQTISIVHAPTHLEKVTILIGIMKKNKRRQFAHIVTKYASIKPSLSITTRSVSNKETIWLSATSVTKDSRTLP